MNGLIIKLQSSIYDHESRENVKINKLQSSIAPIEFIRLLRKADVKVNPRSPTDNPTVKSILDTLEETPHLFWYKSKGLLLASESCELLDRNRLRLSFDDKDHEGIMDGGHNTLAIASFIANHLFEKRLKTWTACQEFWDANYDQIIAKFEKGDHKIPSFSIPIEIVYPNGEDASPDEYYDHIAEICAARNNNVQIPEVGKANQKGYYDELKKKLDPTFQVVWRSGDAGVIKAEDVVSMAVLPLIFLQENNLLPSEIQQLSPVSIYSQKSKCIKFFNTVLSNEDISLPEKGKAVLMNDLVSSSLEMVSDIMFFFDKLYVKFPDLYNKISPRFAGMKAVEKDKKKLAPFRTATSKDTYPPAFMYPLFSGIMALMEVDEAKKRLSWKVNPLEIDLDLLEMDQYVAAFRLANYDAQTIGKQLLFYQQAKSMFENYLLKNA